MRPLPLYFFNMCTDQYSSKYLQYYSNTCESSGYISDKKTDLVPIPFEHAPHGYLIFLLIEDGALHLEPNIYFCFIDVNSQSMWLQRCFPSFKLFFKIFTFATLDGKVISVEKLPWTGTFQQSVDRASITIAKSSGVSVKPWCHLRFFILHSIYPCWI